MKTLLFATILALGSMAFALSAQDKTPAPAATPAATATTPAATATAKMSVEDQYHLRALNAEIDTIQLQINELAKQLKAPEKVQEKNALVTKVCAAAKIPVDKCVPDANTGTVTAQLVPPAPPNAVKK